MKNRLLLIFQLKFITKIMWPQYKHKCLLHLIHNKLMQTTMCKDLVQL